MEAQNHRGEECSRCDPRWIEGSCSLNPAILQSFTPLLLYGNDIQYNFHKVSLSKAYRVCRNKRVVTNLLQTHDSSNNFFRSSQTENFSPSREKSPSDCRPSHTNLTYLYISFYWTPISAWEDWRVIINFYSSEVLLEREKKKNTRRDKNQIWKLRWSTGTLGNLSLGDWVKLVTVFFLWGKGCG